MQDATADHLYQAMDLLLEHQERIEQKLAAPHLVESGLVLYDVSSSSYEGLTRPLVHVGHKRDGNKQLPIIDYKVRTEWPGAFARRPYGRFPEVLVLAPSTTSHLAQG